jgi:hydroxymethylbilane synthase
LAGEVHLAVHSLKDLPTEPVDGLVIAAVPPRASASDVLVMNHSGTLTDLPHGAGVGTGSLRRQAQLRHVRPDLKTKAIRGNVETRLRKLDEGQFDAIVLAEAGLQRLGLADRITHVLPFEVMLPAVGQGALAIECRSLLSHLRGGCMAPVGALGQFRGDELQLSAVVLSADGLRRAAAQSSLASKNQNDAEQLGRCVAENLLSQGAAELIHSSRSGRSA